MFINSLKNKSDKPDVRMKDILIIFSLLCALPIMYLCILPIVLQQNITRLLKRCVLRGLC